MSAQLRQPNEAAGRFRAGSYLRSRASRRGRSRGPGTRLLRADWIVSQNRLIRATQATILARKVGQFRASLATSGPNSAKFQRKGPISGSTSVEIVRDWPIFWLEVGQIEARSAEPARSSSTTSTAIRALSAQFRVKIRLIGLSSRKMTEEHSCACPL